MHPLAAVDCSCSLSEVAVTSYKRVGAAQCLPTWSITLPADPLDILAEALLEANELCRRKWSRPHLGKPSYEQRGVSLAAYRVYWDGYVWPSWKTHSQQVPDGALRLTCTTTTDDSVRALLSTGWFD